MSDGNIFFSCPCTRHCKVRSGNAFVLLGGCLCLCRYGVQWGHVVISIGISISLRLSADQRSLHAYVNDVLTEHKHKHKRKKKDLNFPRVSSMQGGADMGDIGLILWVWLFQGTRAHKTAGNRALCQHTHIPLRLAKDWKSIKIDLRKSKISSYGHRF